MPALKGAVKSGHYVKETRRDRERAGRRPRREVLQNPRERACGGAGEHC